MAFLAVWRLLSDSFDIRPDAFHGAQYWARGPVAYFDCLSMQAIVRFPAMPCRIGGDIQDSAARWRVEIPGRPAGGQGPFDDMIGAAHVDLQPEPQGWWAH